MVKIPINALATSNKNHIAIASNNNIFVIDELESICLLETYSH